MREPGEFEFINRGVLGCDLDPNSVINLQHGPTRAAQGCRDWPTTWKNYVGTYDPDIVAIELGRWEVEDRLVDGRWTTIGQAPWDNLYSAELSWAINILSAGGARVVLFTLPYIAQTSDDARTVNRGKSTSRHAPTHTTL